MKQRIRIFNRNYGGLNRVRLFNDPQPWAVQVTGHGTTWHHTQEAAMQYANQLIQEKGA